MDLRDYLVMDCLNEQKLIADAKQLVSRAKREGSSSLFLPVGMVEQLIEKAVRPHD